MVGGDMVVEVVVEAKLACSAALVVVWGVAEVLVVAGMGVVVGAMAMVAVPLVVVGVAGTGLVFLFASVMSGLCSFS